MEGKNLGVDAISVTILWCGFAGFQIISLVKRSDQIIIIIMYSRAHLGSFFDPTLHWINTYGGCQGIRPIKMFCEEVDKSDMIIVHRQIKVT